MMYLTGKYLTAAFGDRACDNRVVGAWILNNRMKPGQPAHAIVGVLPRAVCAIHIDVQPRPPLFAGMTWPVLRPVAVAADILDNRVFAQTFDVEPRADRVVYGPLFANNFVAHRQCDRIRIGAGAARSAMNNRMSDRRTSRRCIIPKAVAGDICFKPHLGRYGRVGRRN